MKRNLSILLLLPVLFLVSSCKKFLEEQSQTDIIPRSASALNELLVGAAYKNNNSPGTDGTLRMLDDDVTQDHFVDRDGDRSVAFQWQPQTAGKPDAVGGAQSWSAVYPRILACNIVLDYSTKVSGTIAEIENAAGQAYLLRAYYYFKLVNLYGKPYTDRNSKPAQDLGVPLILSSDLSFDGKTRNTVAEVYQQVQNDLAKGIEFLERNGKNNNIARISPVAGHLLSSRVQLYMGNWQKAIDEASIVLDRKSDLVDLRSWGAGNQNGKPFINKQNPEALWAFGTTDDVIPFTDLDANYRLSDDLLTIFENGDLRTSVYIGSKQSIKRPTLGYITTVGQNFRVSEALLNRAEAYAQLNKLGQTGNAQLALNDLNTLRKKRFSVESYADLTSSSADDLLDKCYKEKRREFFCEEQHRWFDLRRHGMPSITHFWHPSNAQTLSFVLADHDPAYVLQIPKDATDKNKNLVLNPDPAVRTGH